jgi:hypothetical protein
MAGKKSAASKPSKPRENRSARIGKALEFIASGESVRKSCEMAGIAAMTFLDNVDGVQYARARDAQADCHFDEMADLERECREGTLDPQAFRALLDSRKWRLARMRPQVYGDKLGLEVSGKGGGPIQVADLANMDDDQLQTILGERRDDAE